MIEFGAFRYDSESRLLYRGDEEILLSPRLLAVLESLLKRPGKIVPKEEVLASAWDGAFVGEESLTQAISELRRLLGDDPQRPLYIQTVPRRGYRLIAEVSEPLPGSDAPAGDAPVDDPPVDDPPVDEEPVEEEPTPSPSSGEHPASRAHARTQRDKPKDALVGPGSPAPLSAGGKLGRYELVARIGAGAMGEVWRARDTELDRQVAIKLVATGLVDDEKTIERFRREARMLAAVDHPNIATIYGVEEQGGVRFIVMELVAGQTLQQRLERGTLPIEECLEVAGQVAEALEAAHGRGIIHRDLKPANVLLTENGRVKVLDFGLARHVQPENGDATAESTSLTKSGVLLGTAPYMSPEQVRGQPVDKRTDLWAFGCLLYEMLTGASPFRRDTVAETLAAILEREPNWEALPPATPLMVRALLRRCLRRDPTRRLHDIADARIEIEEAIAGQASAYFHGEPAPLMPEVARSAARPGRLYRSVAAVAVVVVAAGALAVLWRTAAGWWNEERTAASSPVTAWDIVLPGDVGTLVSFNPVNPLAVSPSGSHVAYMASVEGAEAHVYLRSVGYPESTEMLAAGESPFFSPDGRSIGYFSGNELKKISVVGQASSTICVLPSTGPRSATWAPDGTIFFHSGTPMMRVDADGGDPEPLPFPEDGRQRRWPQILPGGRALVYVLSGPETVSYDDAEIAVFDLATGDEKVLPLRGSYPRYLNTGHLVYQQEGTLRAVRFDLERLQVLGGSATVIEGVQTARDNGRGAFGLSDGGLLAYVPGAPASHRTLVWVDRDGQPTPLTEEREGYDEVAMSPDGRRLAVTIGRLNHNVWIYELANKTWNRLTHRWDDHEVTWTPDSERVVFSSNRGGGRNLFWAPADGSSGAEPLLPAGEYPRRPRSISADYRWLAYTETHPSTGNDLWLLPLSPEGASGDPRPFLARQYDQGGNGAAISPDGQWIAYTTNDSGRVEIKVTSFPEPGPVMTVSSGGGRFPRWARDSAELFFYSPAAGWMAARRRSGAGLPFEAASLLFSMGSRETALLGGWRGGYDVAYDEALGSERFVTLLVEEPMQLATHIGVVQNWGEELKRLLPPQ